MDKRGYYRKTLILKQETESFSREQPKTAIATIEVKNGRGKVSVKGEGFGSSHAYLVGMRKGENRWADLGLIGSVFTPDNVAESGMGIENFDVMVIGQADEQMEFPWWSFVGYMDKKRDWRKGLQKGIKEPAVPKVVEVTIAKEVAVAEEEIKEEVLPVVALLKDKVEETMVLKDKNPEEIHEAFRKIVENFGKEMRESSKVISVVDLRQKEVGEKVMVSSFPEKGEEINQVLGFSTNRQEEGIGSSFSEKNSETIQVSGFSKNKHEENAVSSFLMDKQEKGIASVSPTDKEGAMSSVLGNKEEEELGTAMSSALANRQKEATQRASVRSALVSAVDYMFATNQQTMPFKGDNSTWIRVSPRDLWELPINHGLLKDNIITYAFRRYNHLLLGKCESGDIMLAVPDFYSSSFRVETMKIGASDFRCDFDDPDECYGDGTFGYWVIRLS